MAHVTSGAVPELIRCKPPRKLHEFYLGSCMWCGASQKKVRERQLERNRAKTLANWKRRQA